MTVEETRFFKVVDEYSRERHKSFVSELNPDADHTAYTLCFRPIQVARDSDERYACRYVRFTLADVKGVCERTQLPPSLAATLDRELSEIARMGG